jgi:hypothetical protein
MKSNAGTGIPASVISLRYRYRTKKNTGIRLRHVIQTPTRFYQKIFSGTGLTGCWSVPAFDSQYRYAEPHNLRTAQVRKMMWS